MLHQCGHRLHRQIGHAVDHHLLDKADREFGLARPHKRVGARRIRVGQDLQVDALLAIPALLLRHVEAGVVGIRRPVQRQPHFSQWARRPGRRGRGRRFRGRRDRGRVGRHGRRRRGRRGRKLGGAQDLRRVRRRGRDHHSRRRGLAARAQQQRPAQHGAGQQISQLHPILSLFCFTQAGLPAPLKIATKNSKLNPRAQRATAARRGSPRSTRAAPAAPRARPARTARR